MIRGLGVRTWLRLTRTNQKLERAAADHLKPFGLSLAQFDVLAHVGAAEGLPQQELADSLLVTKGNVCQLVDRLEARGLIDRRPDGRTNRLYLSEAGRALDNEVVPSHEAAIEEALSVITAAETLQLFGLLRKLDRALTPGRIDRLNRDDLRLDKRTKTLTHRLGQRYAAVSVNDTRWLSGVTTGDIVAAD